MINELWRILKSRYFRLINYKIEYRIRITDEDNNVEECMCKLVSLFQGKIILWVIFQDSNIIRV